MYYWDSLKYPEFNVFETHLLNIFTLGSFFGDVIALYKALLISNYRAYLIQRLLSGTQMPELLRTNRSLRSPTEPIALRNTEAELECLNFCSTFP